MKKLSKISHASIIGDFKGCHIYVELDDPRIKADELFIDIRDAIYTRSYYVLRKKGLY